MMQWCPWLSNHTWLQWTRRPGNHGSSCQMKQTPVACVRVSLRTTNVLATGDARVAWMLIHLQLKLGSQRLSFHRPCHPVHLLSPSLGYRHGHSTWPQQTFTSRGLCTHLPSPKKTVRRIIKQGTSPASQNVFFLFFFNFTTLKFYFLLYDLTLFLEA